jgi:hypothetical protein
MEFWWRSLKAVHSRMLQISNPAELTCNSETDELNVTTCLTSHEKLFRKSTMKRITFSLKPEPPVDTKQNQEWKNYSTGKYPKTPLWLHGVVIAMIAAGMAIGCWAGHGNIGFFAGIAACFILVITARPIRCPQCRGPVITRDAKEEDGYRRFLHDCPACKVTWECEKRLPSDS